MAKIRMGLKFYTMKKLGKDWSGIRDWVGMNAYTFSSLILNLTDVQFTLESSLARINIS